MDIETFEPHMRAASEQAREAVARGDNPFGRVLLRDDAVVTTPVVDVVPDGELQLAFVVSGVQLSTGDWVGVYTDDDEERFQI